MSPKKADRTIRTVLIEEAARLIAEEGVQALTLRRLTKTVGVSTMAVYTHFGSMDDLRRAIREEGFARLAARMDAVEPSDDAVADLVALGWAYHQNAMANPNLYRAMFMEECVHDPDGPVGLDTFARLVAAVRRCIDAGRFRPADPVDLATQLWVMEHGVVALLLAGYLAESEARTCRQQMGGNLLRSFGDEHGFVESLHRQAIMRLDTPASS